MKRSDLRDRTRFFIDEPTEQNFTDADINMALNIAQDQVQLEVVQTFADYFISPTPTTINLVPGTETYDLADDVLMVKRVEDGETGLSILPLDVNEKVAPGTGMPSLVSSVPGNWYLLGNSIGFTPSPSATGTVNYWYVQTLPDLATDDSVSQLPKPHHDILAVRAAIDCLIKDEADVTQLKAIYAEYLDRLKRTIRVRQAMAPRQVRRAADYNNNNGFPPTGLM